MTQYPLCKGPPSPSHSLSLGRIDLTCHSYLSVEDMVKLLTVLSSQKLELSVDDRFKGQWKLQGKLKEFLILLLQMTKSQYSGVSIVSLEIPVQSSVPWAMNQEERQYSPNPSRFSGALATDSRSGSLISKPWDLRVSAKPSIHLPGLKHQVVLSAAILTMETFNHLDNCPYWY